MTKQGVDAQAELQRLQAQLEAKNRDLEQLKKQAGQNINAFNESVDAQNKTVRNLRCPEAERMLIPFLRLDRCDR